MTKQESKDDYVRQNQKYQNSNFSGRSNTYFPADQKDLETLLEGRAAMAGKTGLSPGVEERGEPCEETEQKPPPEYMNSNNQQQEQPGCPQPQSSEYIQLALANGPVSNGYIQIQQLPKNVLPEATTTTTTTGSGSTTSSALKPEVALVENGLQCPGYSQVGLIKAEPPPPVSPGPGYIQFPSSSVLISPGLLDQSSEPRAVQLRNTIV